MDTIAAIATPIGAGGIAIVRISGEMAFEIGEKIFSPFEKHPLREKRGYTACLGVIHNDREEIDKGIALVFHAPKSYTGEDVVELQCHGGVVIARLVLEAALDAGAVMAQPGEFSKRAFMNGKMSFEQAESLMDFIQATSLESAKMARCAMKGAIYQKSKEIADEITALDALFRVTMDYPDEDLENFDRQKILQKLLSFQESLSKLLEDYQKAQWIKNGVQTAIVGAPNVGKSTIMNLLTREKSSIVADRAGTTRDVVKEEMFLDGFHVKLCDTAGIHQTGDEIEQIGIEKSMEMLENSDLILFVINCSQSLSDEEISLMQKMKDKAAIAVLHKTDLEQKVSFKEVEPFFKRIVFTSQEDKQSIVNLKREMIEFFSLNTLNLSAPMLVNERQKRAALCALNNINACLQAFEEQQPLDAVAFLLEDALDELLSLSGENVQQAVVDEIFSHYCVGK